MKNPFSPAEPEVLEPQYLVFRDQFLIAQLEHRGKGFMVSVDLGPAVTESGRLKDVFDDARRQAMRALTDMLNESLRSSPGRLN